MKAKKTYVRLVCPYVGCTLGTAGEPWTSNPVEKGSIHDDGSIMTDYRQHVDKAHRLNPGVETWEEEV